MYLPSVLERLQLLPNRVDPKVMFERAKKMRDLGNAICVLMLLKNWLVPQCGGTIVRISGGLFDVQVDPCY